MGKIRQNLPNNLDSIVSQELDTASIDLVKCSDSLGNMGGGSLVVDGEEVREDLATVKCLVPSLNF